MDSRMVRPADWGIADGYHAIDGRWITPDPEAVDRVLAAMGATDQAPPPAPVLVVHSGEQRHVGPAEIETEDGVTLGVEAELPADLPLGYHLMRRRGGGAETRLIVSPGRCRLPRERRAWGWSAQLYAVRSQASWGIGDLGDLWDLGRWATRLGARMLMINPLHAPLPLVPQEPSPYYPSSRRYRNPIYIRIEAVPGAHRLGEQLAALAAAGRALNRQRRIDRDRVYQLKMQALEQVYAEFPGDADFDAYRHAEGAELADYATFCMLSEVHGGPWRRWPEDLRRPDSPAVARARGERLARVRFHQWLQWLLDRQLAAAAGEVELLHDLPIGVQADGADAWVWQDMFADGVTVGAPPDPFNSIGQDWSVPPFDPWRLRAAAYEPFVKTLRAAFRYGSGLRIDHVMGLFRLYWIPAGLGPTSGAYVRYPFAELLDILALESHRAGAYAVGEDLGTVEDAVRSEMAARDVLSYRLMWFEDRPPGEYRPESLAALTTHDLPTLAGIWEGSDPDPSVKERLCRNAGVCEGQGTEQVAELAYRSLAASPSRLVAVTLEDALGLADRPNRPGTTSEWPNWSLALPVALEELREMRGPARLAAAVQR